MTISADTLRFVRTCNNLSRAIAQHKSAERKVTVWEAGAAAGNAMSAKMVAGAIETASAWFLRVAELFEAANPEAVALAPVVAPVATQSAPQSKPADAGRVRAMRQFFAVAKWAGLNVKDALGMTWALAKYLGRVVSSRAHLSAGSWAEAVAGVEFGLLAW